MPPSLSRRNYVQFDAMDDSELRVAARLREARDLAAVHNWHLHSGRLCTNPLTRDW